MNKIGEIEIRIIGKSGKEDLKPDNYDITHIIEMLSNVEDLLFPDGKKNRPVITYDLSEGSVRHLFKTAMQAVIGFSAVLGQIQETNSIDFLSHRTAKAIENIQEVSREKNYEFQFLTSLNKGVEFSITPETRFERVENIWVDAEFYFYGIIKDAGGKNKANIHLDTKEYGYLTLQTGQEFLEHQEENLLYRQFGARVIGKQHIETGEINTKTLKLIELIDYNPKFDEDYLSSLIAKAKKNWQGVDTDDWLQNIRGDYEA